MTQEEADRIARLMFDRFSRQGRTVITEWEDGEHCYRLSTTPKASTLFEDDKPRAWVRDSNDFFSGFGTDSFKWQHTKAREPRLQFNQEYLGTWNNAHWTIGMDFGHGESVSVLNYVGYDKDGNAILLTPELVHDLIMSKGMTRDQAISLATGNTMNPEEETNTMSNRPYDPLSKLLQTQALLKSENRRVRDLGVEDRAYPLPGAIKAVMPGTLVKIIEKTETAGSEGSKPRIMFTVMDEESGETAKVAPDRLTLRKDHACRAWACRMKDEERHAEEGRFYVMLETNGHLHALWLDLKEQVSIGQGFVEELGHSLTNNAAWNRLDEAFTALFPESKEVGQ